MSEPQSPTEAIRSLLFRKAELLTERLLTRLTRYREPREQERSPRRHRRTCRNGIRHREPPQP